MEEIDPGGKKSSAVIASVPRDFLMPLAQHAVDEGREMSAADVMEGE
jgi:hypothetical protein